MKVTDSPSPVVLPVSHVGTCEISNDAVLRFEDQVIHPAVCPMRDELRRPGPGQMPFEVPSDRYGRRNQKYTLDRVDGEAFRTNSKGDVKAPSYRDVDQGWLSDCWLMSSLAAVAHREPDELTSRITKRDDGTFAVRLGDDVEIVDPTFPKSQVGVQFADPTPRNKKDRMWVALFEKAMAQRRGGSYAALEERQDAGLALELLTGREAVRTDLSVATQADVLAKLEAGDASDSPMIFATRDDAKALVAHHTYAVLDLKTKKGVPLVKLYDPLGRTTPGGASRGKKTTKWMRLSTVMANSKLLFAAP